MVGLDRGSNMNSPQRVLSPQELLRINARVDITGLWMDKENLGRLFKAANDVAANDAVTNTTTYELTNGQKMRVEYRGEHKVYVRPHRGFVPCGHFLLSDIKMKLEELNT